MGEKGAYEQKRREDQARQEAVLHAQGAVERAVMLGADPVALLPHIEEWIGEAYRRRLRDIAYPVPEPSEGAVQ